jgi:alpha-L-rhamnosidase
VVGFLHRYVAGLEVLEPGYRRFRVAPRPGGGVTWARTHHESPLGRIEVSWHLEDGTGRVEVAVPEGATAEVVLPGLAPEALAAGTHVRTWEVPALAEAGADR